MDQVAQLGAVSLDQMLLIETLGDKGANQGTDRDDNKKDNGQFDGCKLIVEGMPNAAF
jgi:uncharacterized protein YukJ